jgi:hypothetical protein
MTFEEFHCPSSEVESSVLESDLDILPCALHDSLTGILKLPYVLT